MEYKMRSKIFSQTCSKKEELWKQSCSPELLQDIQIIIIIIHGDYETTEVISSTNLEKSDIADVLQINKYGHLLERFDQISDQMWNYYHFQSKYPLTNIMFYFHCNLAKDKSGVTLLSQSGRG